MSTQEVFQQALALSDPQRAELAQQLLQSLAETPYADEMDEDWVREIERRMELVSQGKDNAREWREVVREIRCDLQARKSH